MIKYGIIAIGVFLSLTILQGNELPPQKITIPLWTLLLDTENSEVLPARFRTTKDALAEGFDSSGLANLCMSGSAQFSALQFKAMADYLNKLGFFKDQILVVDLREEPHGFINGNAFTWYAKQAWWVHNDPVTFIIENEKNRLAALPLGQSVLLKYITHKNEADEAQRLTDHSYVVACRMTEEQVVKGAGAHYVRLAVTDHMRPDDKDVEQFLALVKKLPPQIWVHFHCRAGRGRTSTFMIMYDMIRNPGLSKKAIIDRQVQLGSHDIRRLSAGLKAHKNPNEKLRRDFINLFYEYVQAPDGYGRNSWTKWNMHRHIKFLKLEMDH